MTRGAGGLGRMEREMERDGEWGREVGRKEEERDGERRREMWKGRERREEE